MPNKDYHEANRLSWNAATKQHNTHKGDQAKFLREGGSTLFPEEIELLGDVRDKTLLHLQCNAGQDTLSIANKLGAAVTGVDISDEAITFARKLAQDSGIPAQFHRGDVYDWLEANNTQYDVVFASYGALVWLSDLVTWGRGVAKALKPGGRVVVMEFHPVMGMFGDNWQIEYDYMGGQMLPSEGVGDYVALSGEGLIQDGEAPEGGDTFVNPHPAHEFTWGLSDVVMALVGAGLRLTLLREYPYSNGFKPFDDMRQAPGKRMYPPEDKPIIPLMYGLVAEKPNSLDG